LNDLSNNLPIDTPENVILNAEIAGFGTRCLAAIFDYIIIFVILIVVYWLAFRAAYPFGTDITNAFLIFIIILFLLMTFYHLLFELFWNGQTPGKRFIRLRVVQANGLPLTATGALIRNLVRLFDFFPVFYGIGLIVMFASSKTQRLGDLAAGTIVIRERGDLKLTTIREDFRVNYLYVKPIEPIPSHIQVDRLDQQDRRMVIDFLQRRFDMQDRINLGRLIARRIATKMEYAISSSEISYGNSAEIFLERVARAFELAEYQRDHPVDD
jgi:uncharacterized RDD family membrane protein YckC